MCADAQADLSLRWAHTHFVGFVMSRLISKLHQKQWLGIGLKVVIFFQANKFSLHRHLVCPHRQSSLENNMTLIIAVSATGVTERGRKISGRKLAVSRLIILSILRLLHSSHEVIVSVQQSWGFRGRLIITE